MTLASPIGRAADRPPERRVLTAVELDVLWEWLGIGPTPVVLRLSSPGRTHDERRRIVAGGWRALRERGLADLNGPDPGIVRLLHLLATPTEQVELRMRLDRELRVLAVRRGPAGALAVRQDETVTLSPTSDPVAAVVGALPGAPAGPGGSVTVPSLDLDQATGRGTAVAEALTARGVPEDDAVRLDTALRAATGRGQVSVLATDPWGVLRRHRRVLGLLDTDRGRYVMHRRPAADGVEWTTLAPVDQLRLTHRVRRLLGDAHTHAARP
jgi:hypothetical protein